MKICYLNGGIIVNNMDDLIKEKVKYDQVDYPNENEMWSKIIRKQQNQNYKTKKT